jgi:hypothetical protein
VVKVSENHETILFVSESNLRHLIRAIRENTNSYIHSLNEGVSVKKESVAMTIGNDEALKLLGIYTGADTKALSKWLWSNSDWKIVKEVMDNAI